MKNMRSTIYAFFGGNTVARFCVSRFFANTTHESKGDG